MKYFIFVLVLILFAGTLFAQTATPPSVGDGSSGNPYQIATLNNLYWITQNSSSWTSYFIQTADIDASSTSTWDSGAGFSPIGNGTINFNGSYDGQAYKITCLFINRGATSFIGLFGYVQQYGPSGATITNVKLDNVHITGADYVGGLTGVQSYQSTATNCYSSGSVTGGNYVGGLIGLQQIRSTTSTCYNSGSVMGFGSCVGGLIGYQNTTSTATNCYSSGSVTGDSYVGGLIGLQQNYSTDNNCYSTGSVTGGSNVGGLIGLQTTSSSANNCFWDTTSSGQTSSAGGTGKSTAEMKTASTFTGAGWDFTTVWEMIGTNYPRLKAIPDPALPVELTSFTATSSNSSTILVWKTATEVNNYGFEVLRRVVSNSQALASSWGKIGFVQGNGTSNAPHEYSFTDQKLSSGSFAYRLKQVDNNGTFKYSQETEVSIAVPKVFALSQNFPNPFNPSTMISFDLPVKSFVSLKVFDLIGREVASIVSEEMSAGNYTRQWNAANMSSGIYFYRLQAGSFSETKKLVLLR